MYNVELMPDAVGFIEGLGPKIKAKVLRTIDLLEEFGPFLREPHSKKIKGTKELFELRIKQGSDAVRMFYFYFKDNVYVLTSGLIKKTNKIERNQIKKAEALMIEYMEDKR